MSEMLIRSEFGQVLDNKVNYNDDCNLDNKCELGENDCNKSIDKITDDVSNGETDSLDQSNEIFDFPNSEDKSILQQTSCISEETSNEKNETEQESKSCSLQPEDWSSESESEFEDEETASKSSTESKHNVNGHIAPIKQSLTTPSVLLRKKKSAVKVAEVKLIKSSPCVVETSYFNHDKFKNVDTPAGNKGNDNVEKSEECIGSEVEVEKS